MKKLVVLILSLAAALCLTTVALADVITIGPELLLLGVLRLLPYLLVAAVVVVTIILLRKSRKRK